MVAKIPRYYITTLIMKNLKFKSLEKSLVNPLVLFQKKFFKELNGSIFRKRNN